MTAMVRSPGAASRGFTLIEVLAALAIASVVILATAELTHNVALNFDRGTRGVSNAEHLLLAIERLAGDFASARWVPQSDGGTGALVAFAGDPTQVKFVAAGGVAAAQQGEEVISLAVEQADGISHLTRRRAPWLGPSTRFDGVALRDPVRLIEGSVDMEFAFGRVGADGAVSWSENWSGQSLLPRLVRLTVKDRASGAELIPGAQFVLRADAPFGCAQSGAKASCLGGGKPDAPGNDNRARAKP
jgi:prepilin-type N-terminal cleavage/methylation domain-containing protein